MGAVQSIVAAATRVLTRKGASASSGNPRGAAAWDMWETVPEVQAYAGWVSNAMTGARLIAGKRGPDGTVSELPANSRAAELIRSIAGGVDGQGELLGGFGTHLAVSGESWLIIVPNPQGDSFADDRWVALSSEEVSGQRGKLKVKLDGEEVEILEPDAENPDVIDSDQPVAIRIWDPSPRRHWEATSPVMGSLTVLEELRLLSAAVAAIARSRITGRGVLLVPAGTRFPAQPGQEKSEDSLLDTFIEVASTAIREPESAAATVPIILEIPGDLIAGVKWLQFSSEFDAMAIQLRDEAIRRFATGADVPAEVLLGLGDTNHWGAWAITAEALRMGAEPRLGLVAHALTDQWLRPLLEAEGDPDAAEALVWYDTSGLRSSSNKGASALEAFKEGLISASAARRELGFTDADGPTDEELKRAKTVEDLPAPTANEGNELPVNETQTAPADGAVDQGAAVAASLADVLTEQGALIAAVDGIAWNAMWQAGQKIMRTPACPRPDRGAARDLAASASVHTKHPVEEQDVTAWRLLDGAWQRVPEVAARYGVHADTLTAALDDYATALLVSGQAHSYDHVVRMLAQSGIIPSTIIGMVKQ
jgi:hypothetical protein